MSTWSYHVWGEGPDDVGRLPPFADADEGCYDALVQRAAPRGERFARQRAGYMKHLKRLPGPRRYQKKGLKGFGLQGYLATREAMADGVDLLVIGTDSDRESQRATAAVCLRKRRELRAGYDKACADAAAEASPPKLVCIVPLRKLEAWLLADAKAFRRVTGKPLGSLPKPPEALGGKTDPKELLDALGASGHKIELARRASPDVLEHQCPVSYPPFREDVRAATTVRP